MSRLSPCLNRGTLKIHQESEAAFRHLEVGEELRLMNRRQCVDGLHLNHHRVLAQQIEAIARSDRNALVGDRQGDLSLDAEAPGRHLISQAMFIGRLQQTWPKTSMNLQSRINDCLRERLRLNDNRLPYLCSRVELEKYHKNFIRQKRTKHTKITQRRSEQASREAQLFNFVFSFVRFPPLW